MNPESKMTITPREIIEAEFDKKPQELRRLLNKVFSRGYLNEEAKKILRLLNESKIEEAAIEKLLELFSNFENSYSMMKGSELELKAQGLLVETNHEDGTLHIDFSEEKKNELKGILRQCLAEIDKAIEAEKEFLDVEHNSKLKDAIEETKKRVEQETAAAATASTGAENLTTQEAADDAAVEDARTFHLETGDLLTRLNGVAQKNRLSGLLNILKKIRDKINSNAFTRIHYDSCHQLISAVRLQFIAIAGLIEDTSQEYSELALAIHALERAETTLAEKSEDVAGVSSNILLELNEAIRLINQIIESGAVQEIPGTPTTPTTPPAGGAPQNLPDDATTLNTSVTEEIKDEFGLSQQIMNSLHTIIDQVNNNWSIVKQNLELIKEMRANAEQFYHTHQIKVNELIDEIKKEGLWDVVEQQITRMRKNKKSTLEKDSADLKRLLEGRIHIGDTNIAAFESLINPSYMWLHYFDSLNKNGELKKFRMNINKLDKATRIIIDEIHNYTETTEKEIKEIEEYKERIQEELNKFLSDLPAAASNGIVEQIRADFTALIKKTNSLRREVEQNIEKEKPECRHALAILIKIILKPERHLRNKIVNEISTRRFNSIKKRMLKWVEDNNQNERRFESKLHAEHLIEYTQSQPPVATPALLMNILKLTTQVDALYQYPALQPAKNYLHTHHMNRSQLNLKLQERYRFIQYDFNQLKQKIQQLYQH